MEVMHLIEIVNEFIRKSKPLELLSFGDLLSIFVISVAEWHFLFYDDVNSIQRPLDIIIFDYNLYLQHVEATMFSF